MLLCIHCELCGKIHFLNKPTNLNKHLSSVICFSVLCCGLCFTVCAQQPKPAGFANTYTLTDADGFPGFNYTKFKYSPWGEYYASDFFGNFHFTGNNFIKRIDALNNLYHVGDLFIMPNNEVLRVDDSKRLIYVIKNDSLLKTIPPPSTTEFNIRYNFHDNYLLGISYTNNTVILYELKNEQWVLLQKIRHNYLKLGDENFKNLTFKKNNLFLQTAGNQETVYHLYEIDTGIHQIKLIRTNLRSVFLNFFYDDNLQENKKLILSFIQFYAKQSGKQTAECKISDIIETAGYIPPFIFNQTSQDGFILKNNNATYTWGEFDSTTIKPTVVNFESKDIVHGPVKNLYYPYITLPTGNKPLRVFPYIKKYPHIYNNDHADNIFMLTQDDSGRIWAGSYQNYLSIIAPLHSHSRGFPNFPSPVGEGSGVRLTELGKQPHAFMNAGISYNNKIYVVGEDINGGILQYNMQGNMHKLQPQTPVGYYLYLSAKTKQVYFAPVAAGGSLRYCSADELNKPVVHWNKLNFGLKEKNWDGFRTITEDSLGRLWCGHPKYGFVVYHPQTKQHHLYEVNKNQTPIGFISSVTDNKGTVFMGSDDKGLWYYNDYTKSPAPQNIHCISHPLLNNTKRITAMTVYKNWLVLGCYNKICLLNLDSFHVKHKAIVRYLNPQETAFTSFTEQNTMLVNKKDSTLWFSTSDMLYQWDIKTWLQLPQYKVNVQCFLQKDSSRTELNSGKTLQLQAGTNSFDIVFEYLSPDCLPRYTRTALIRKGDSIIFSEPNMQSKFSYKNLSSGKYIFYVEVFEQDGSTTHYEYSFVINKHFWYQWWFWTLASFIFLTPFILWLNTSRTKAIQQKQMSQMNLVTLASQFRPHFILNALNTIGADLKDKPAAETVISRLGESINLIFNQTKQKRITHSLKNEWTLVENVIQIHRIMYLPELKVQYPDNEWMQQHFAMQVPMGIIEVIVENALLHGLRNKKNPPYLLTIEVKEDETNTYFIITDNGIGRKNATNLSSYKNHGIGTKNLFEIMNVLNKFNSNPIKIIYTDDIFDNEGGTSVTIAIPRNYHYQY